MKTTNILLNQLYFGSSVHILSTGSSSTGACCYWKQTIGEALWKLCKVWALPSTLRTEAVSISLWTLFSPLQFFDLGIITSWNGLWKDWLLRSMSRSQQRFLKKEFFSGWCLLNEPFVSKIDLVMHCAFLCESHTGIVGSSSNNQNVTVRTTFSERLVFFKSNQT